MLNLTNAVNPPNPPVVLSFDIAEVSLRHVLGVMFPKSRASSYAPVVAICKGGTRYWEADGNGLLHHFAAFDSTPEQIARALAVANYGPTMSALRFYARGLPIVDTQRLYESLKCYVQSQQCADPRAHCVRVVRSNEDGYDWFAPCSLLANRWPSWPFNRRHPSTPQDQLQAMAVTAGCDWCPNFDASKLRQIDEARRLESQKASVFEWTLPGAKSPD